ncbi:hypothetical protein HDU67_004927, partial [Dinochytrium kinnereticum]
SGDAADVKEDEEISFSAVRPEKMPSSKDHSVEGSETHQILESKTRSMEESEALQILSSANDSVIDSERGSRQLRFEDNAVALDGELTTSSKEHGVEAAIDPIVDLLLQSNEQLETEDLAMMLSFDDKKAESKGSGTMSVLLSNFIAENQENGITAVDLDALMSQASQVDESDEASRNNPGIMDVCDILAAAGLLTAEQQKKMEIAARKATSVITRSLGDLGNEESDSADPGKLTDEEDEEAGDLDIAQAEKGYPDDFENAVVDSGSIDNVDNSKVENLEIEKAAVDLDHTENVEFNFLEYQDEPLWLPGDTPQGVSKTVSGLAAEEIQAAQDEIAMEESKPVWITGETPKGVSEIVLKLSERQISEAQQEISHEEGELNAYSEDSFVDATIEELEKHAEIFDTHPEPE